MNYFYYLGIDVSKESFDLHLRNTEGSLQQSKHPNSLKGIKSMVKNLEKIPGFSWDKTLVCMEKTGIYVNHLISVLSGIDANIWVEKALQIKKTLGMVRGKDDKVDAQRIAEYCFRYQDKCKLWAPLRSNVEKLKKLSRIREQLIKTRDQLKISMNESISFECKELGLLEKHLKGPAIKKIENQITNVDKLIQSTIKEDTQLQQIASNICSITGIGKVTAAAFIVTTNEFKQISEPKKFACYAGVAPFPYSSGKSINGREKVSHLANKRMKTLLHLCALSAITAPGELKNYYERKVEEGKNKMKVLNAVRNKLIHRVFAVVRDNKKYEKNYQYYLT